MSIASNIPLPAPLKTTASNLAAEWKRFKGQWTNYTKAAKVDRESADCEAAILLACLGADAYTIYESIEFADDADRANPTRLLQVLEAHFIGETNEVYERYVFSSRNQQAGETFDTFLADLRRLVKSCDYGGTEDSMVRDRIVLGVRDDATRRKLLGTRKLDLPKAIDICRALEATARQFKAMTAPDEVQALKGERSNQHRPSSRRSKSRRRDKSQQRKSDRRAQSKDKGDRRCRYCRRTHDAGKHNCPAYGSTCSACGRRNHWAAACESETQPPKDVKQLSDDESLLALDTADSRRIYSNVYVNGKKIRFLLDCGSTVNIIPKSIATSLGQTTLRPPRSTLRMFDRTQLPSVGMFTATLRHPLTAVEFDAEFYVTERDGPIIGIDACRRLDLLRIVEENICTVHETTSSTIHDDARRLTGNDVMAQFADLFDGSLGLLDGEIHLDIDTSLTPVQMPLRRLPVAIRERVGCELNKMEQQGIIEPVTKPTP